MWSCSNNACYSYSGSACFKSWQVAGLLWQVFTALFHKIGEIEGYRLQTGHNVPILDKNLLILMNSTSRRKTIHDSSRRRRLTACSLGWFHVTFEVDGTEALPPPKFLRFSPADPNSIIAESVLLPEVCDSRDPTTHCHFLRMTLRTAFHHTAIGW